MAKADGSVVNFSGKIGDKVFVKTRKSGNRVRKAPPKGTRREEPAFKKQYMRAVFLNNLASELNRIIGAYSGNLKSADFYQRLLTSFRKEAEDNRFLLFLQLKGMDVNTRYPFVKLGSCKAAVKGLKNQIVVNLKILSHPEGGQYAANCYYYEVSLLTWSKSKKPATHSRHLSEWIGLKDKNSEFEFSFPRPPATVHWLLCLRQRLGVGEKEIESFLGESMQITDAGTFDKKDEEFLRKRIADKEAQRIKKSINKTSETVVRIKAKKSSS